MEKATSLREIGLDVTPRVANFAFLWLTAKMWRPPPGKILLHPRKNCSRSFGKSLRSKHPIYGKMDTPTLLHVPLEDAKSGPKKEDGARGADDDGTAGTDPSVTGEETPTRMHRLDRSVLWNMCNWFRPFCPIHYDFVVAAGAILLLERKSARLDPRAGDPISMRDSKRRLFSITRTCLQARQMASEATGF